MLALGYALLGALVGLLCGLSSSPIVNTVMAALFAFVGGSVTYLVEKHKANRQNAGSVLAVFSASAIAGVLLGIVLKENRLLSSLERIRQIRAIEASETNPGGQRQALPAYLKGTDMEKLTAINVRYANHQLDAAEAYKELWSVLETSQRAAGPEPH